MTSGILNGTLIGVYKDNVLIARAVSSDLDITMATRETTNKDTAGWKTILGSTISWSCTTEAMHEENIAGGFPYQFSTLTAKTAVTLMISSGVSGDKKYTGSAFMTNLKRTHPHEGNVTWSCTFEGTGALTEATIS